MMHRSALACAVLIGLLSGCSSSGEEELQQWMAEQRKNTLPKVDPIPEPKKFVPQAYTQEAAVDPFSNVKLTQALKRDSTQSNANAALVAPELARRKEPLGSLIKQGLPVALVKVDNLLYQVHAGNYVGQNYGRITKVGENEVTLREIVQDAGGEWIERIAKLQLQERSK
jgi:type IV pilus assembly protein PilP